MKKLLTSILAVLSTTVALQAQRAVESPKLVVGIVIDQLRGDYLNQFYELFGEGGFKRLMRDGAYFHDTKFDFPKVDQASAIATIYSGANPWYNGIIGLHRFDREKKKAISSLLDPSYMGNFTDETVSPRPLLVSTITDELKEATDGFGTIFSFAPDYEAALLAGGHAADGAFWIDNRNRKWATSTYFPNIPFYFELENSKKSLADRMESMVWKPLNAPTSYRFIPYQQKDFGFAYPFKRTRDNLLSFKTSGLINEEVNRMVLMFFDNETFGKHTFPDFLTLTLYAGAFQNKERNSHVVEMQDLYLRLDKQLELLLNRIDASVGLKNALVFVSSTGYFEENGYVPEKLNIPTGTFYVNRATALLNMYLMSIYGHENWVTGYYNHEIFLNKKLIEDKRLDLREFEEKAADFMIQMSGVQDVITSYSLLHNRSNNQIEEARNGFHRKLSGDLLIELQPDWQESNEDSKIEQPRVNKTAILSPLFFFGNGIKPIQVRRQVKATEIAPTVAYFLRIRAPSACSATILPEFQ
ncbi:MAG: alkaline phosphatase family protein [Bacteroidales bacterium]|nr:alkaline phosphatase family protein [Bacteroidales bacterium]